MPADRFLHSRAGKSLKVSLLTDLEYRVWTQYLLSADDFGVMRADAITLQADNDHLANRPAKLLVRCMDSLVRCQLLQAFKHQGRRYLYQGDWQDWQKVTWPSRTIQPMPPPAALARCSSQTRLLFDVHPGGRKAPKKFTSSPDGEQENFGSTSEVVSPTREWLTANGKRLMANGSEGGPGETAESPPFDAWFQEAWSRYPEARRSRSQRAQYGFFEQLSQYAGGPVAAWALFQRNLAANLESHEWRVKGMTPGMEKYIREGLWLNTLPAAAPAADRVTGSTATTLAGAAEFIAEGRRGTK